MMRCPIPKKMRDKKTWYKLCTKCHKMRNIKYYVKDASKRDGLSSSCKDCYRKRVGNKKRRPREIMRGGIPFRWCTGCKRYINKNFFYSNSARKDGIHGHCKSCARKDGNSKLSKERQKSLRQRQRVLALMAYGGSKPKCKCCGESTYEFLCIDHIRGGGNAHRKEIGLGHIYRWLIANKFPKGFQVLCHNCNLAKGFYGKCPHKAKI